MKPSPSGWPRLSSAIFYEDPRAAIAWLEAAFGFERRIVVEDGGVIHHSELTYGEAVVMVAGIGTRPGEPREASPRQIGGRNTQSLFLYVDDVDSHCERARDAGATILMEPKTTDHGAEYWSDRSYEAIDPEGHRWWFSHRVRG